jgi:hypothetical protein
MEERGIFPRFKERSKVKGVRREAGVRCGVCAFAPYAALREGGFTQRRKVMKPPSLFTIGFSRNFGPKLRAQSAIHAFEFFRCGIDRTGKNITLSP